MGEKGEAGEACICLPRGKGNRMHKSRWLPAAKAGYTAMFVLAAGAHGWLLYRMKTVRDGLPHPESSLFLARVLPAFAMAACLVLAVWGLVSIKARIKRRGLAGALMAAAVLLGILCLGAGAAVWRLVAAEYAQWPGGAMF